MAFAWKTVTSFHPCGHCLFMTSGQAYIAEKQSALFRYRKYERNSILQTGTRYTQTHTYRYLWSALSMGAIKITRNEINFSLKKIWAPLTTQYVCIYIRLVHSFRHFNWFLVAMLCAWSQVVHLLYHRMCSMWRYFLIIFDVLNAR